MFDSVDYVRGVCEKHGIPVSKLEKDCGFSNGYLNPKKLKKIPYDRAIVIAEYLSRFEPVTAEYIMTGKEKAPTTDGERDDELAEYLDMLRNRPECRMLFSLAKGASKEDVERTVAIIEALREKEGR